MSAFPVSSRSDQELLARMVKLGIREEDLDENFIRGSGAGGQKINKTSVCVQLTHRPTGIMVRCQRERSQALNRFFARRELCDKIEAKLYGKVLEEHAEISKRRRQKARRSRRNKQKLVEGKRHQGEKKKQRSGFRDHE